MTHSTHTLAKAWPFTVAAAALVAACAMAPAMAARASASMSAVDQAYQQQRQRCLSGQSNQDQATCLREAVSARDQARRGQLQGDDARTLAANALLRCQVHKAKVDREACESMVRGEGEVSGSSQAGGRIQQITTLMPGTSPSTVQTAPSELK